VVSVLELFKGPLAGMRFGDVDADGLASLAAKVDAAGAEVADGEARLAELQQGLAAQQEALLAFAQRALAYARVYAESHEELLTELNGISLPRPLKPRKANAPKPSDAPSALPSSVQAQLESAAPSAELAPLAEPVEGRAVELDSESMDAEAMPVLPPARKSRRSSSAASKTPSDGDERASASASTSE
jgi:hypothetical protein